MAKNITGLLKRGNLKPKDRVKLLLADSISKETDGKALLTEADRYNLSEGWTPKDNEEVKEYNNYTEGVKTLAFSELDAQTTYLNATIKLLRAGKFINYVLFKGTSKKDTIKGLFADKIINRLLNDSETDKGDEAISVILSFLGLNLEETIIGYSHNLASKDKELQDGLAEIYPDAETRNEFYWREPDNEKHKELLKKWTDIKTTARETIQGLIDKGELKIEERKHNYKRIRELFEGRAKEAGLKTETLAEIETETEPEIIITGVSLYNSKADLEFITSFKKQVDGLKLLGAIILFLRKFNFIDNYAELLGYLELHEKLSKVFDTDLTIKIKKHIEDYKTDIRLFESEIMAVADDITELYIQDTPKNKWYLTSDYTEDLLATIFETEKIKPNTESIKIYFDAFKKLFGNEF